MDSSSDTLMQIAISDLHCRAIFSTCSSLSVRALPVLVFEADIFLDMPFKNVHKGYLSGYVAM